MERDNKRLTAVEQPHIDYLAKDFASFRQLMLDHLSVLAPNWTEESPADLGHVLVEVLAYAADYLSYYQDAAATEAYLGTARLRRSVRRHARLLDYFMHEGCNARVWVQLKVNTDGIRLPQGTLLLTNVAGLPPVIDFAAYADALRSGPQVFETLHDLRLFVAHSEMRFHVPNMREDAVLPQGSTSAWLKDDIVTINRKTQRKLGNLQRGDVLIFEEILDPKTGDPTLANTKHRHAVRLTKVSPDQRPSKETMADRTLPLVKIEWAEADALPFPFYIAPYGKQQNPVTVARGNVVLADHGRRIVSEELPPVLPNVRYRPPLRQAGLTQRVAYRHDDALTLPATETVKQDPRQAMPDIRLLQQDRTTLLTNHQPTLLRVVKAEAPGSTAPQASVRREWNLRRDLLNSDRFARDYLIEMEEDERAFLRFGFGDMGILPKAGDEFIAQYRIGNGARGNVGPDTINHVVVDNAVITEWNNAKNAIQWVRNPLPAQSGTDPEQNEEVRLHAPYAFNQQERCITAADYAEVAARYPGVAQAEARIQWTGVWRTVFIYIRRDNSEPLTNDFRTRLRHFMETYRHVGYEVAISDPTYVPLQIELSIYLKLGQRALVVQSVLAQTFSAQTDANGVPGFFHPANFGFGQPVYRSRVVAAAMATPGVARVEVIRFGRMDGARNVEEIPIGPLEIAELQNDPDQPQKGTIVLKVIEPYEQSRNKLNQQ